MKLNHKRCRMNLEWVHTVQIINVSYIKKIIYLLLRIVANCISKK